MMKLFLFALFVAATTAQCFGNGCGGPVFGPPPCFGNGCMNNNQQVVVVQSRPHCLGSGCGCVGNGCNGVQMVPGFGWGNSPCCSGSNFSCCNRQFGWGRK